MTKLVVTLSLALIAVSLANAADITLKDGRVLRDAVVVRHDAATVTFRHTAGFAQIEKTKLPEPLAAEYPLDTAQAKLEAEQQRQDALARRAEAERLLALRVQLAATAPKPEAVPVTEEPKQDTTPTASWIDNYNTESWRLMRARARHHDRDCNRDSDLGDRGDRHHRSDYDNHRDLPPPPPPPPASTVGVGSDVHMVPDVHMTSDVKMMGVDTPPSSTVPPPSDTDQRTQGSQRF
jgi:hypothetical protein